MPITLTCISNCTTSSIVGSACYNRRQKHSRACVLQSYCSISRNRIQVLKLRSLSPSQILRHLDSILSGRSALCSNFAIEGIFRANRYAVPQWPSALGD
ncbi:hypothetical protein CEXT_687861 [Caerostris extrusa]|uniref:Uncharacterized protein n=1 Tax=Caerostris extrusa TaxID=172846 RepID=A0AAV4QPW2_CAEEX|nr:hypothetical protein CEXT_687861 [Caerostris extrusa]